MVNSNVILYYSSSSDLPIDSIWEHYYQSQYSYIHSFMHKTITSIYTLDIHRHAQSYESVDYVVIANHIRIMEILTHIICV